jgi:hypothetical protein
MRGPTSSGSTCQGLNVSIGYVRGSRSETVRPPPHEFASFHKITGLMSTFIDRKLLH